jgi:putative aldouronate transport system substrate-binding protein
MKKYNKALFPVVGSIVLVTLITACSSENSSGRSKDTGKSPSPEKTITYKLLRNFGSPEYPADGGEAKPIVLKKLNEMGITGLDYKVTIGTGDEYYTKLNLAASSGELPDLFDINPQNLQRFVKEGLIQPLDKYLKDTPNIMKVIPNEYWKQVTFDGKIYAIPNGSRPEPFNFPTVGALDIRTDWLENLQLKKPTTLDELHDVLKAFVTQDPDKNGKNDTVGLGAAKNSGFGAIFGAFGIYPTFWTERNGQIKKGLVLPEMKEALTVLQKWYGEKLIDPDFPIMETKQLDEKAINSLTGLWHGNGYWTDASGANTAEALYKASPKAKVAVLDAPKGPKGLQGYNEANAYAASPLRSLSKDAQDPVKLFKFLDWQATTEGAEMITYGVPGVDFTYDKATNSIMQKVGYANLYSRGWSNPIRFITVTDRRWAAQPVRDGIEVVNKHLIKNAMWNTLPAENDYPDLESKLYAEYFVKIVTGTWTVDKYDEFITKYYAQGGKVIEDQANALYKDLKK